MSARKHNRAGRERNSGLPVATSHRRRPENPAEDFQRQIQAWSDTQAELNHVETIEEANDFDIHEPEDSDFFHDLTPYEMLDVSEMASADAADAPTPAEPVVEPSEPADDAAAGATLTPPDDESHDSQPRA